MQDISRETLDKALRGDMDAFEEIYRSFSGFVYAVALRIMRSKEDAEEVTQDVFIKLHKNLWQFEFRSSFKTWVYRVTANTALNLAKKRQLEKEKFFEFDDKLDVPDESLKTDDAEGREDAHEQVEGLLGLLNAEQRACVVLRNIEGLSYQEVADALKVNINTVRTRLKRAREKMAERGPALLGEKEKKNEKRT